MVDLRCPRCHHLLFKYCVGIGRVEIKCPRCNHYEILTEKIETEKMNVDKLVYQGIFSYFV